MVNGSVSKEWWKQYLIMKPAEFSHNYVLNKLAGCLELDTPHETLYAVLNTNLIPWTITYCKGLAN